ncbi:MAG: Flp pilus assembly protein CpaB [Candidatus Eremiobacteraeota bacterium]|nr:Flp pilus assembly protein CpaB [Candidatus Eremiobacteraeota bacterium]
MKQKKISLIIAGTLALATGFLTLNYLSSVRSANAASATQLRTVVVAAQDIPARVTITRAMLKPAPRDVSQIEPDALIDPHKALGSYSLISIPAGASITASKIGRPQSLGLAVLLKRGMRAVSIGIDKVKGVSDLIQPGDRVDVIAVAARVGSETPVASTILRGAIVLALGSALDSTSPATATDAQSVATVTLGVTPVQANLLAMADINATLRLALRSPQEPVNSLAPQPLILPQAQVERPAAAIPAVIQASQVAAPLPAAQPAAKAPATGGIQVLYGNGGAE